MGLSDSTFHLLSFLYKFAAIVIVSLHYSGFSGDCAGDVSVTNTRHGLATDASRDPLELWRSFCSARNGATANSSVHVSVSSGEGCVSCWVLTNSSLVDDFIDSACSSSVQSLNVTAALLHVSSTSRGGCVS